MSKKTLLTISGTPVYWINETFIEYTGEMTSCADGSPRAYGPKSPPALDYLGNAGYDGNWWGIVTDSYGDPYVQQEGNKEMHPYPGLYISCTAYFHSEYPEYDCRRWVDAEKVQFSVIPSSVRSAVPPKFLGCRASILDKKTGQELLLVCAEIGPSTHLGEASMCVCTYFGLKADPKAGGELGQDPIRLPFLAGRPDGWVETDMTKAEVANMWERIVVLEKHVAELRVLALPTKPRAAFDDVAMEIGKLRAEIRDLPETMIDTEALGPPRDRHLPRDDS